MVPLVVTAIASVLVVAAASPIAVVRVAVVVAFTLLKFFRGVAPESAGPDGNRLLLDVDRPDGRGVRARRGALGVVDDAGDPP